ARFLISFQLKGIVLTPYLSPVCSKIVENGVGSQMQSARDIDSFNFRLFFGKLQGKLEISNALRIVSA
ncbi:MAG: hypothetical protein O9326_14540, partial [Microcystis sp. LE19-338.1B]|nr:hypothetical protein [Microcystis sp. LE19-338.1B]